MIKQAIDFFKHHKSERENFKKFRQVFDHFNSLDANKKLKNEWMDIFPFFTDNTKETEFDAHYIYHPAWAARIVRDIAPLKHIDISSTLHFCSILSAFIPVEFYDYRPANLKLTNLHSGKADLTNLHFASNSIQSLSCMHTIEHIGLGRYGEPLDPDADVTSINELKRVVAVNGSLLFVTPVGKPKIQFNAHRIYPPELITNLFKGFTLKKFSLVLDNRDFLENAGFDVAEKQNYGCGCFWFIKEPQ